MALFVVVKGFDFESFDKVFGPFTTYEEAKEFADSKKPTHWEYDVAELFQDEEEE